MDKYLKMIDDLAMSDKSIAEIDLELHVKSLHEARQDGYTKGCDDGYEYGFESASRIGEKFGALQIGEPSFHCIESAIDALEKDDVCRALGILRVLRDKLAHEIGRSVDSGEDDV